MLQELLFVKPKKALVKVNEFVDSFLLSQSDDSTSVVPVDEGPNLDVVGYCQLQREL